MKKLLFIILTSLLMLAMTGLGLAQSTHTSPLNKPFLMPIKDVSLISHRTLVTGQIEQGTVKVGDEVEIVGLKPTTKTVVTDIEMFRKPLDQAQVGDNVGILLRGVNKENVERGQVLAKPGSIMPHTQFTAEVYMFRKDEGSRHTPFSSGYRPQFYFRTVDVTGKVQLPQGVKSVMPGDNVKLTVTLIAPIAMDTGFQFTIFEDGRPIGFGQVTKIIK